VVQEVDVLEVIPLEVRAAGMTVTVDAPETDVHLRPPFAGGEGPLRSDARTPARHGSPIRSARVVAQIIQRNPPSRRRKNHDVAVLDPAPGLPRQHALNDAVCSHPSSGDTRIISLDQVERAREN